MVGEDTFYERADKRDGRVRDLVHAVTASNPAFIAGADVEAGKVGLAEYLRATMLMRSAAVVMAAEYVAAGGERGRSVVARALQRADEPAELLGRVQAAAVAHIDGLADWSYAAALGAGRAVLPHMRRGAIATLVLSGFFHSGSQPETLKHLLDGARNASSTLELDDPLLAIAQLLRAALMSEVGPDIAPRVFAFMTSDLS